MTEQTLAKTWKESGKYEKALALLQKTMEVEEETVVRVEVSAIFVNPDHTTNSEAVTFNRFYQVTEE